MTKSELKNEQTAEAKKVTAQDEYEAEQARLREEYLRQQQRRACPGCGEAPFLG